MFRVQGFQASGFQRFRVSGCKGFGDCGFRGLGFQRVSVPGFRVSEV